MKLTLTIILSMFFLFNISCRDNVEVEKSIFPTKTSSANENTLNQIDTIPERATSNGVFKGSGGEPFWSIRIEDGNLVFETPDEKIHATVSEIETAGNSTTVISNFDKGTIKVIMIKEKCIDGMSGMEHSHNVEIQIKTNTQRDFSGYKGCGSYQ